MSDGNLEERRELVTGLARLARRENGGKEADQAAWERLFAKYDRDKDGRISPGELTTMLEDANVGWFITRSGWVDNIIFEVDNRRGDKDGTVSLKEFQQTLKKMEDPSFIEGGMRRVNEMLDKEFANPAGGAVETFKQASSTWGTVAILVCLAALLDVANLAKRR